MYWVECDGFAAESEVCCLAGDRCPDETHGRVSARSRLATTLLVLCLGQFGAHRFYAGKTETALSMLVLAIPSWLTPWHPVGWFFVLTLVVWILIDSVLVISGQMEDAQGDLIKKWWIHW
jgi:TM2 domain-containing membrane protein YozV